MLCCVSGWCLYWDHFRSFEKLKKLKMSLRPTPFWEDVPSCSRCHAPTGQQTPAVRSHRTAHWGLSGWQHETWVKKGEKTESWRAFIKTTTSKMEVETERRTCSFAAVWWQSGCQSAQSLCFSDIKCSLSSVSQAEKALKKENPCHSMYVFMCVCKYYMYILESCG